VITTLLAADAVSGMSLVDFISSAGIGALICGVLVAVINGIFNRGGKRADAAKALIEANQGFTTVVSAQYQAVHKELWDLKMVVITLTDTIDEILPKIEGISTEDRLRLRKAYLDAKLRS
jgi:hypothetical protein